MINPRHKQYYKIQTAQLTFPSFSPLYILGDLAFTHTAENQITFTSGNVEPQAEVLYTTHLTTRVNQQSIQRVSVCFFTKIESFDQFFMIKVLLTLLYLLN